MFSRRLIVFTLILLFFMLPGCGEVEETPGEEEKFSFVYNGVEIVPGEDIAPVLALGEPTGYGPQAAPLKDWIRSHIRRRADKHLP